MQHVDSSIEEKNTDDLDDLKIATPDSTPNDGSFNGNDSPWGPGSRSSSHANSPTSSRPATTSKRARSSRKQRGDSRGAEMSDILRYKLEEVWTALRGVHVFKACFYEKVCIFSCRFS